MNTRFFTFIIFIKQGFWFWIDSFIMVIIATPLFCAIYYIYKNLSTKLFYKILQIILLPLIAIIPIPSLMFYLAIQKDDRWFGFGAVIISFVTFLLYLANEIYLIWNLRKRKI